MFVFLSVSLSVSSYLPLSPQSVSQAYLWLPLSQTLLPVSLYLCLRFLPGALLESCLLISFFVYLSACILSICKSVCLSVFRSVSLPVCLYSGQSVFLSVCIQVSQSSCLSVCWADRQMHRSIDSSVIQSAHLCLLFCLYLSVFIPLSLSHSFLEFTTTSVNHPSTQQSHQSPVVLESDACSPKPRFYLFPRSWDSPKQR